VLDADLQFRDASAKSRREYRSDGLHWSSAGYRARERRAVERSQEPRRSMMITSQRAAAIRRPRIARLAASRMAALLYIGATFAFSAQAAVANPSRGALWRVVQACLVSHALMGAAFPCLEVNVSRGDERGYVVLQLPFGASDPMLAPTRRIVGVEDPSLAALDAPNYFADAWGARKFLQDAPDEPLPHAGVVLAQLTTIAQPGSASHPYRVPQFERETDGHGARSGAARRSLDSARKALSWPRILGTPARAGRSCRRQSLSSCGGGLAQSVRGQITVDNRGRRNRAFPRTQRIRPARFVPKRPTFGRRFSCRSRIKLSLSRCEKPRMARAMGARPCSRERGH